MDEFFKAFSNNDIDKMNMYLNAKKLIEFDMDKSGATPIFLCAINGNHKIILKIVRIYKFKHKVSEKQLFLPDNYDVTPLAVSVFNGHYECTKELIKLYPKAILENDLKGFTVFHVVRDANILEILLKAVLNEYGIGMLNHALRPNYLGDTPLHSYAFFGSLSLIKMLFKYNKGRFLFQQNNKGDKPYDTEKQDISNYLNKIKKDTKPWIRI